MRAWLVPVLLTAAVLAPACSSHDDVAVHLAPTIVFPKGVLDNVAKVTLSVYDDASNKLDCSGTDGTVTGLAGDTPIANKDLLSSGCAAGFKFCGDVQVAKSDNDRVFAAQAFGADQTTVIANGCTHVKVNQDTLQVQIKMLRFVPPAMCAGKVSPVPVQCKAPGSDTDPASPTLACGADCLSKEIYVSKGDLATTSDTKQKGKPSFVWPAGTGNTGRFLGFWGDHSPSGGRVQVAMRVLTDAMAPYADQGPIIEQSSTFMPTKPGEGFPPSGDPQTQNDPTAAFLNDTYYIAFEDLQGGGAQAISLRSMDTILTPQQNQGAPIAISDSAGSAQTLPSMAFNGAGKLFIAWENSGVIVGRTVDTGSNFTKGTQNTIGPQGKNVAVAGTATGWVAVYQNGTDVDLVTIDGQGAASTPKKVNDVTHSSDRPSVATLQDGTIAVAWADSGGIYVQRYSASLQPVANDQALPINDPSVTGAQAMPTVGAGATFFVVAWVDTGAGHIRARYLDGTGGFLFNDVNGQDSDFQVSLSSGKTLSNPAVAVGGSGPYVAIGWEDDTGAPGSYGGVWARRFLGPQAGQ